MASMTVFGLRTEATAEKIDGYLRTLYGERTLSDKEKKKLAKLEKFNAKKEKLEAPKGDKEKEGKPAAKKEKASKSKESAEAYVYKSPAPGEKKDTSGPMAPAYNPKEVEDGWYAWWMKQGFFKPEYNENEQHLKCTDPSSPNFTIVIPPPNVTGSLHVGHALTNAIEDALTRWHRMNGKRVLWNPGADHAGIATQMVVEKKLARERKLTRHDLGREAFVAEVWRWKEQYGARIYEQLKALGASLDWDREAFTMAPRCCKAVTEAFVRLHAEGLIYRADRLVNWSCRLNSAISDIEVDKRELGGRTALALPGYEEKIDFGVLTSFAYTIVETGEEIVVATTRPETMLGDVAVAVHPDDKRYQGMVGKHIKHPFVDRTLVVVADSFVDMGFGTGAVKITPGHDQTDYECGQRHQLPVITVMTKHGNMADNCGAFSGMKRFSARAAVVAKLKELGLFRGEADNAMVVPICSRSGDVVEPLRVPQWFLNCSDMARAGVEAVRSGALKIMPAMHEKVWYNWLENIRDWCISRQLWWGHRIPAYFVTVNDPAVPAGSEVDNKYWVSAHTEAEARAQAAARFQVAEAAITLRQDEDVLDTWFSSGIFPISIFGWPDATPDLQKFYPGQLLETGYDILFFWVARMVMMCTKLTGQLPFKEVFLHSIVRDAHGRKMSKSLGNVIDPMDIRDGITLEQLLARLREGNLDPRELERAARGLAEDFPDGIPQCGIDALRFALCAFITPGRDINLDVNRIHGYRTFCNKVFNAIKFARGQLGDGYQPPAQFAVSGQAPIDLWILHKASAAAAAVQECMKTYDFAGATSAIHGFWLYDLCDVYLEASKPTFQEGGAGEKEAARHTLYTCCDVGLRLLAPFMPFLAEELWQRLPRRQGDATPSVCVAAFPTILYHDEKLAAEFDVAYGVVTTARAMRTERLEPKARPEVYVRASEATRATLARFAGVVQTLVKASKIALLGPKETVPEGCVMSPSAEAEVFLLLKGLIDVDVELGKLAEKKARLRDALDRLTAQMASPQYSERVPEAVRAANAQKAEELRSQLSAVESASQEMAGLRA